MSRKKKLNEEIVAEEPPDKIAAMPLSIYNRLGKNFFNTTCKELAFDLLGKILVRKLSTGSVLRGRIVETECYLGGDDKASNTYNNRRTPANEPMYMPAGTAFIYMTYGMYHCFNISSIEPGAAVLIRAVEPIEDIEIMAKLRIAKSKRKVTETSTSKKPTYKTHELCNGPSKLCMSMQIEKASLNKEDMITSDQFWVESDQISENTKYKIVTTSRIGINSAGPEWANKPLRYYILNNTSVSKRDVKAESIIEDN